MLPVKPSGNDVVRETIHTGRFVIFKTTTSEGSRKHWLTFYVSRTEAGQIFRFLHNKPNSTQGILNTFLISHSFWTVVKHNISHLTREDLFRLLHYNRFAWKTMGNIVKPFDVKCKKATTSTYCNNLIKNDM